MQSQKPTEYKTLSGQITGLIQTHHIGGTTRKIAFNTEKRGTATTKKALGSLTQCHLTGHCFQQ
uniref:Uncharacterized protein n=1 Tax=Manihot esculenta TaxID=3983 RepID=A0A2C9W0X6_MANES